MDEFDLDYNTTPYGGGRGNGRGTRKVRQVRRHDVPDPRPVEDPFTAPEPETVDRYIDTEPDYDRETDYDREPVAAQPAPEPLAEPVRRPRQTKTSQSAPSKPRRRGGEKREPGIVRFFKDRRLHIFVGVLCILAASLMCITLVSHLRSAAADQSMVLNQTVDQMAQAAASGKQVANTGGAFGAWLSHALFTDALGLGAFVMAIYFFALGGCIIARWRIRFWSFTFKCLLLAITVSVVTGLVTYGADTAYYLGGTHGHYVNRYLFAVADWVGPLTVSFILLTATVCVFLYPIKRCYLFCKEHMPQLRRQQYDEDEPAAAEEPAPTDAGPAMTVVYTQPQGADTQSHEDAPVNDADNAPAGECQDDFAAPDTSFAIDGEGNDDDTPTLPAEGAEMQVERPEIEVDESLRTGEGFAVDSVDENAMPDFDPHAELPNFELPPLDLLEERQPTSTASADELEANRNLIVKTLANYGINIVDIKATVGPTITLYEIVPEDGTRIRAIKSLEDDIAMSLAAKGIRIIAPLPGKAAVGIEVPNKEPQTVSMRSVLESKKFSEYDKALPIALGATISNEVFCLDVAAMPHALVAGATGMGKSVGLNAIIASLLYKKHPADLKFVLVDPKMVEFSLYAKLEKHYLAKLPDEDDDPIVTDSNKVLPMLQSLCVEMDQRYALLKDAGVRDIKEYNKRFVKRRLNPDKGHRYLPYIVVIIDEFADLIMMGRKEIETPVTRITQKARAVGIHMIIATQRPSTNVLTGLIKANCPSRIAFRVNQMVDSRTILDRPGANQLIGRGDMLYSAGGAMERIQCAFISTDEVERICDYVNNQVGFLEPYYLPDPALAAGADAAAATGARAIGGGMDRDPLFDDCARFLVSQPNASTSILQRRFEIGYNRAGKIIDQMEAAGIVGPPSGNKPRAVLVDMVTLEAMLSQQG